MRHDDKFESLEVCTLCVTLISLDVWQSTSLQVYKLTCCREDVNFRNLEGWEVTYCV